MHHQEIRGRVDAATPGPWEWADGGSFGGWWLSHRGDPTEPTIAATRGADIRTLVDEKVEGSYQNQEFIAHARTDMVTVLDENEMLRGRLTQAKMLLERWQRGLVPVGDYDLRDDTLDWDRSLPVDLDV